jgi:hypothetical protein
MKTIVLAGALAATWALGCGSGRHVQKGIDQFAMADYQAAMEQWAWLERSESRMNAKGRVRYLTYRGLTHYEIYLGTGDPLQRAYALHYLSRGKRAYDQGDRDWLDAKAAAEVNRALADLGGTPPALVVVELPPCNGDDCEQ